VRAPIAMTTLTCACVNYGNQKSTRANQLATRVFATTRSLALTWSLAVLGCARQKLTGIPKMLLSEAAVVELAVTHPKKLAQTVSKILTSVLRSGAGAHGHAGQRARKVCAHATTTPRKRRAEHGWMTCGSAARKSAAQCRAQRMVSRSVRILVARLRTSTVPAIAMITLTVACKSIRTATSGLARKPEMLAIAPKDMVGTGRNVKRP